MHVRTAERSVRTSVSAHQIHCGQGQWPHWWKASHSVRRCTSVQSNHRIHCAKSTPPRRYLSRQHTCSTRAVGFVLHQTPRHVFYQCSALVPVQIIGHELLDLMLIGVRLWHRFFCLFFAILLLPSSLLPLFILKTYRNKCLFVVHSKRKLVSAAIGHSTCTQKTLHIKKVTCRKASTIDKAN